MKKIAKVEGHPNLIRDLESGAIVNINRSEQRLARERKKIRMKEQAAYMNLKSDVDQLKNDIGDIKDLLTKLVEK